MSNDSQNNLPLPKRLEAILPDLGRAEAKIARILLNSEATAVFETGASLARKAEVSEITVSRLLRRLGFRGMKGLREAQREQVSTHALEIKERTANLLDGTLGAAIKREAEAVLELGAQIARPEWELSLDAIASAEDVYVTGFQMVRGLAEDFARRASIIRDRVRFISANDGAMAEWTMSPYGAGTLIIIDTLPYANSAETVAMLAKDKGMQIIYITDEANNAAYDHTDLVLHCKARNGLFIESVGGLGALMAFLLHALAERNPVNVQQRLRDWDAMVGKLEIF